MKSKTDFQQSLPVEFYRRPADVVAPELLGKMLVRRAGEIMLAGIIVETEAYEEDDPSSHSYGGRRVRNAPMFEAGGIIYVYKIYGMHLCMNIVTGEESYGSAVLVRAVEPVAGIDLMQERRHTESVINLCNGPGKVGQAFGFTKEENFASVCVPDLFVQDASALPAESIVVSARIGITKAVELPRRFYINNNPYVSKAKPAFIL